MIGCLPFHLVDDKVAKESDNACLEFLVLFSLYVALLLEFFSEVQLYILLRSLVRVHQRYGF